MAFGYFDIFTYRRLYKIVIIFKYIIQVMPTQVSTSYYYPQVNSQYDNRQSYGVNPFYRNEEI
jgi:hypothetical protein